MPSPRLLLSAIGLALLATAGCAGDGGPVFDAEGSRPITCMQHQPEPPGSRYTDPERRDTAEVLAVLRYYTAHGRKPYCDGAGPTRVDRAWARFYLEQGADPANLAPPLRTE